MSISLEVTRRLGTKERRKSLQTNILSFTKREMINLLHKIINVSDERLLCLLLPILPERHLLLIFKVIKNNSGYREEKDEVVSQKASCDNF